MFAGRTAVITGAGSGIGRALAQQLAVAGARLALSDVNRAGLDETLGSLPAGVEARGYALDVADRAAVFAHAQEVERDFGAAHFVFNNAGTTLLGSFAHLEIDEIEWQLSINLWGVIYGCKAFLPGMLERREGCLVNISSVFGLIGFPLQSAYNISKFGVRGLTECLWQELEGTGVRAVCVHPGGIRTSIEKSGRRCRNAGELESGLVGRAQEMLITPPEECAVDILAGVAAGKRRILTGNRARTLSWLARLFPAGYPTVLRKLVPLRAVP
jgi:NAD(P)-dependent dehydrogenase (short-subunit alcohol dehydrogenase family)